MKAGPYFISSHILEEVETLASRILLMVSGKLAAAGDFRAIRAKLDEQAYKVRIVTDAPRAMAAALVGMDEVDSVSVNLDGELIALSRKRNRSSDVHPAPGSRAWYSVDPRGTHGRFAGKHFQLRCRALDGTGFLAVAASVDRPLAARAHILAGGTSGWTGRHSLFCG